ncbi:MAG: S-layer homology domain-containing protein, partial [Oscillospiraceae bacterium]
VFEGSGEIASNGNDQYLELFQIENVGHVRLTQNSRVSVSYIDFGHRQDNAFDGVGDLTVDAGSVLALDAPAKIEGNLVLNGSFASAREVMDNYVGFTPNAVYPALLTVGGTATGNGEVLTMKPKNWVLDSPRNNEVLLSTPTVGEIYITAQKTGSDGQFLLQNDEPTLFLNRIDQPGQTDTRYAWQIATGRVVTFDKNGGDTEAAPKKHPIEIPDESATYYAALPTTLPTRTGYTFMGWNTAENGSGTAFTDKTPVTASLTVYAQWTAIPTYAVTYTDGVDGEEVFADQTTSGLAGGAATPVFSGTPTRSGYTFTGWSPAVVATVTANATYTAQWSRNSSGGGDTTDYYTLTYASNGGTKFPSQTYAEGTRVQLDKLPVREGYTFTGWYGDKELTQKRTEVRMDRSKTVYAGWQAGTVPEALNGKDHFAYVVGYTDGTVRPLEDISRAEVATIFFRLLKEEVRSENLTKTNRFADIQPEAWHNTPISTMAALGVVKGRGETVFDPDASITRAEFAAICARFDTGSVEGSSNFTDVAGHWAQAEIERAAALGWIQGYTDGSFRPDAPITRAEAMTLINRVLCRIPESESDLLKDMTIWPDNQPGVWYYLAVQEATNGHDYRHKGAIYEEWVKLIPAPDWSKYEG